MKVLTAIGARPQFIKAAPVSRALAEAGVQEVLVHSGQHYDREMSQVFFDELGLRAPDIDLGAGSGSHAEQTARMLVGFEQAIVATKPDVVIVHGDTNSTLAAALAAVKVQVKVAHNEAGLRSFNRSMPEEHNRVLTDHCSDVLFCPTRTAMDQLASEGIRRNVHLIGDVMCDASQQFAVRAEERSTVLRDLKLEPRRFVLATFHRPHNVDSPERLAAIFQGLASAGEAVVLPQHPRLALRVREHGIVVAANIQLIEPVGYLDMVRLEQAARIIVTDSGGVQKEAYLHGVPCVTVRPETEWVETVQAGWNRLVAAEPDAIRAALLHGSWPDSRPALFGDGHAAERLTRVLLQALER